ncbi:uncharacterized protein LOC133186588 [Saccostrea echinata]|uniref:uncharacterized protein LOC133186588 n=1 Tax=Saccostrea echinata TaxID=191078 RepID=UPI002A80CBDF|nr:uncharacterized protein LOC133186588 [Saccostrea echinata]
MLEFLIDNIYAVFGEQVAHNSVENPVDNENTIAEPELRHLICQSTERAINREQDSNMSNFTREEYLRLYFPKSRRSRCKNCEGCRAENCGLCTYCKDKHIFGGSDRLKQCCINKRCRRLFDHGKKNSLSEPEQPVIQHAQYNPKPEPKIQHAFVFLRDICDEKLLTIFRKNPTKTETEDTNTVSNKAPNDIMTSQNLGRSQRKKKANYHYLNPDKYLLPAKFGRKECPINSDPLEGVDINKLVAHVERQNEQDRKFLQAEKRKRLVNDTEIQCMPPPISETEDEKLHPYGYLKSIPPSINSPAAFSSFKSSSLKSLPYLTKQDKTSNNDAVYTYRGVSDPPLNDLYMDEKVNVGFSGLSCKPNDAYFNEIYTDLDKILPNLNNEPKHKKGLQEREDKRSNTGTEKISTPITEDRAVTSVTEDTSFLVKSVDQSEIESHLTKLNKTEVSMDYNTEGDINIENIENTVYQGVMRETGKEQAKEEKYFQLDIGDKLIFIPTDGTCEIPKAFVLDKPSKAPETNLNSGTGKSLVSEQKSSVDPAEVTESTPVKSELMDGSGDDSLPKITSVFSLSSDRVSAENNIIEPETSSYTTDRDRSMELDSCKVPMETHSASIQLKPSLTTEKNKEVFSLTTKGTKLSKLSIGHSSGTCPASPNPSVCQLTSSSANRPTELKMRLSNLGKLEHLVKSTGKALNQSNVVNLPTSNASRKVAPDVKQSAIPATAQKLLLIPKLSSPHSDGRSTLFITSTQNNKLQNILPNAKLRFVVDKPQTSMSNISSCKRNPGVRTTGLAVIPKDPSRPVLLFPNKTNATFKPIVSRQVTVNANSSLHSKTVPSFFKTSGNNRGNQSNASSRSGLVSSASNNGFLVQSGVLSAVTESLRSSERNVLSSSAPLNTKPNCNDIETQSKAENNHSNAIKKANSFGQEWVTVKSRPGDKHKFEAAILTDVVKEKNVFEINGETPTASERTISQTRERGREQTLEHNITHVHAEEMDTEERIRRLREKMRSHQEECESLKKTLSIDSEL